MKHINTFIESTIEDFQDTIKYAQTTDIVSGSRRDFVEGSITEAYNKAFGALIYLYCYEMSLNSEEYTALHEKLIDAQFEALETAGELF